MGTWSGQAESLVVSAGIPQGGHLLAAQVSLHFVSSVQWLKDLLWWWALTSSIFKPVSKWERIFAPNSYRSILEGQPPQGFLPAASAS